MAMLYSQDLSVGYDHNTLTDHINIDVRPGKITVLLGPNGAGKSTILKTFAGILEPTGGSVYLAEGLPDAFSANNQSAGEDLAGIPGKKRAKILSSMFTSTQDIQYTSCFDVVSVGRYQFTGIMGRLSSVDTEIVERTMKKIEVLELADRDFNKISDGQKKRVLLARALVQEPSILILDEPTGFLDIGYKLEFLQILRDLARNEQVGILLSMHEVELARLVADEVVCIDSDNRIDRSGNPKDVLTREYIRKLYNIKDLAISDEYWEGKW